MLPARSIVAEVQERAKTLRLCESRFPPKQTRCQLELEKHARKAECILLFERCVELAGISMQEFVRRWGHKWSTGYGYLSDEKRFPKARSVRKARAVVEDIESGAAADRERIAREVNVARW